ncbi:MAG: hypothetical protein M0010_13850, partial [Actinomycetota bacterium]|nr:hypothetical protein [Actinomycetota bacterium]
MSVRSEHVAILGTGMTDMSRRDLSPSEMAHQAVHEALADAAIEPEQLALVVASNAMGGRLCDQGSIRAQSWLRKAGLGSVPVVNVDNSCAGGAAAVHVATLAARAGSGPVLVLGVEKMWTGDRAATLAGIEDGLPADYRADMHARFVGEENPGGSILMALNDRWARDCIAKHGATLEQFAAAAVKARLHASRNPNAQIQQTVTVDQVLAAPQVAGILTRLMCSSFTDGAAALVLAPATAAPLDAPRIIASVARSGNGEMDYHERLAETAEAMWEESGLD